MADSPSAPEGFSLKRWSRRKLEAAQVAAPAAAPASSGPVPAAAMAAAPAPVTVDPPAAQAAPVLPPVESLTHDSDFSAFMQPRVDEAIKRAALKKLFTDPRFNVMDGLDIYVGDYTQADPMPEGMLDKVSQVYKAVTEAAAEVEAPSPAVLATEAGAAARSPSAPAPAAPVAATDLPAAEVAATDLALTEVPATTACGPDESTFDLPASTPTRIATSTAGDIPVAASDPASGTSPRVAAAARIPAAKPSGRLP